MMPEKFVLKTNHGSGFNIIVANRTEFNAEKAKTTLSNWLKFDFGIFWCSSISLFIY